jgi:hypothetical protein
MLPGRLETESADYRRMRDESLEAEISLKDQRERVARFAANCRSIRSCTCGWTDSTVWRIISAKP